MSETIEERVRRLEAFRYWALGRINAQNTLLADLWCNFIAASPGSVLATLERLRDQWLADAANPPAAPGLDPAYLELVSQEYRAALESLVEMMRQKLLAVHTTDPQDKRE